MDGRSGRKIQVLVSAVGTPEEIAKMIPRLAAHAASGTPFYEWESVDRGAGSMLAIETGREPIDVRAVLAAEAAGVFAPYETRGPEAWEEATRGEGGMAGGL